ncbi:MAG: iron complex outermembrane receptor protein [Chitinophagales bacterium]|jgi:iron complex outermembrane receptor protein
MNKIPFKRTRFFAACAGVVGVSMLPGHVVAQGMLEEVIVTAQKRAQNLQDVPISVQAFTGQALSDSGIFDMFDLQANAPGLTVDQNQNATTSNFSIRGIGTGGNNFGFESSVGLYVDGVYRSRQSSMINQLVDIQSVDILRGPQGTLFGRNTLSGAIQFTTVKPDHDGSGFGEVVVGNYGLLNLSGAVSISAIEDELAFRLTGFSSDRDGYIDNISPSNPSSEEMNDRDRFGFRVQALWTPNEDLSIHVIADYAELDEVCCGSTVLYDNNRVDQRVGQPTPVTANGPGSDSYFEGKGGTFISEDRRYDNILAHSFLPQSTSEDSGLSVQVDWNIDDLTLTSITAYRSFDLTDHIDADFSDLDGLEDTSDAEQDQFSQEFRLSYIGEKLNYVVGANYFQQSLDSLTRLDFGEDTEFFAGVFSGLFPASGAGGLVFPADGFAYDINEQDHKSWAVFGQADYALTDTLTLTAGLRYSDEHKELSTQYFESGNEIGFNLSDFPATQKRSNVDETLDEDQTTGTVKLSWFMTDDIMLYGSYTTGFKAGGTNTDRIDPAFDQSFDAETSTSYELGMKAEFPDQGLRLNVAVYQADIEDQQVGSFDGGGFNVQNAAAADTYGLEVDMLWQATESTTVNFAYSKTIADFDEFEKGNCWSTTPFRNGTPDPQARILNADGVTSRAAVTDEEKFAPDFCDRTGGRLAVNPEDKFIVGVRQEFNVSDSTLAYGMVEYSYVGDMFLNASNDPLTKQDAYNTVNLRLGLNLEDYQTEITLWGRNIMDEEYLGTSFDAVLQSGKQGAYNREPRTYGLTVNKKF